MSFIRFKDTLTATFWNWHSCKYQASPKTHLQVPDSTLGKAEGKWKSSIPPGEWKRLCFHPSCIWSLLIHPPASPPRPAPPSTLVGGLLIFWMTIWERKRAIASPAAALERAPRLLQILHWRSGLKPAVLEAQNYGRCGSKGAQIGRPVPLESTAFISMSICRGTKSLQVAVPPVNELRVYTASVT